jgi:hypothetical protein
MTEKLLLVFIGICAVVVGSIIKNLIWERIKPNKKEHCEDHPMCIKSINKLRQEVTKNTGDIGHAQEELKEGKESFKDVREDIVLIRIGVKALVTWMKAKGEDIDDTGLFQR